MQLSHYFSINLDLFPHCEILLIAMLILLFYFKANDCSYLLLPDWAGARHLAISLIWPSLPTSLSGMNASSKRDSSIIMGLSIFARESLIAKSFVEIKFLSEF